VVLLALDADDVLLKISVDRQPVRGLIGSGA
jgi:hypothetical protein